MKRSIKYSQFIKELEKAREKTGLKDPLIDISTFISESEFIYGSIEIGTTRTFHKNPIKGIDISINYKETRNQNSK